MEEIEVTARFLPGGRVFPQKFIWQGNTYHVDSIGRSWNAKDGYHILVMDKETRVFQLVFNPERKIWHLIPDWDPTSSFS